MRTPELTRTSSAQRVEPAAPQARAEVDVVFDDDDDDDDGDGEVPVPVAAAVSPTAAPHARRMRPTR